MFTLIYQLFAAGIRHRSAGMEIGASSPFLGGEKAPTATYFALLRGLRLRAGDKKKGRRVVGHSGLVYKLQSACKAAFSA